MALTEEQKQRILKNAGKAVADAKAALAAPRPEGVDILPKRQPATQPPTTASPNQRNQAAAGTAGTTTGDASGTGANTPDISKGFTTQADVSDTPSTPSAYEITRLARGPEGAGVSPDRTPLGVITDSQREQLSANRGFNTQLTQLGATAADGTKLPSRDGTFSTVGSSRTPQEQLASLRETFGTTDGRTNTGSTGGFAVAPDSRTRERNARLNDPRRQFLSDLNRQVRRGEISARAAGGIAANILGQQADITTARERLAGQQAQSAGELAFKREQLSQEADIAGRKLEADVEQSRLGRLADLSVAEIEAASDAAKLGLDREEFAELQRKNLAGEAIDVEKLSQAERFKRADLAQEGALAGLRAETTRLGDFQNIFMKQMEGLPPKEAARYAELSLGQEKARQLFPNLYKETE